MPLHPGAAEGGVPCHHRLAAGNQKFVIKDPDGWPHFSEAPGSANTDELDKLSRALKVGKEF